MTANVGSLDRIIRFSIGLALIVLPFVTTFGIWNTALGQYGALLVGIILVATAVFRFCPLYRIIGLRTCRIA